jgi:DNA-binding CsgD family transcriptional regulator
MSVWTDDEILQAMFRFRTLGETGSQIALVMNASRSAVLGLMRRSFKAEAEVAARGLTDAQVLALCDGLLRQGRPADRLAREFAISRNAVLWQVWAVLNDSALAEAGGGGTGAQDPVAWPRWWRPAGQKRSAA